MRPPWSETPALLAAAGHAPGPLPPPPSIWSRLMSKNIEYAFLSRIDALTRPRAFTTLSALARFIENQRHGQSIQLEEIEDIHARRRMATGEGPAAPDAGLRDRGVQIHTLYLDGGRDRSMGFAWLKGGGREDLQRALEQVATPPAADRRLMHAA